MKRNRLFGIHLLAGSLLTLLWIKVCPEFTNDGQTQLHAQRVLVDPDHYILTKQYYQMDFGLFAAGEAVLWSALLGSFFLLKSDDA
jgi:hypothetical protein